MGMFPHRSALGAMGAEIEGAIEARLLADPDAVRHFGEHGAADRAMGADRFFDLNAACGLGLGFCLSHHAAGQCAGGGDAACCQAGAAKEAAAIEGMAGQAR